MKLWAVGSTIALLGSALTVAAPQTALAAHAKVAAGKAVAVAQSHTAAHLGHQTATSHSPHESSTRLVAAHSSAGAHQSPLHQIVVRDSLGRESTGRSHKGVLLRNAMLMHSPSKHGFSKRGKERLYASGYGGISCVPFARSASGIELKGNAVNWWDAASGVYARGSAPEAGSVLNFRATSRMRLGHVAVVTEVVNSRQVEIDHANWGDSRGGVSRGVPVIDVSANNDWSEVRVGLGRGGDFGSVYPTYGFIYDRPDRGTMIANTVARPGNRITSIDEVAEAPASADRGRYIDAPGRSVR